MKIEKQEVSYVPYVVTKINKIEKSDITKDGILRLPKEATIVSKNALPIFLKPKTIFIPNTDYQLNCDRLKRKINAKFILESGTELEFLFYGIHASEIVLPNTIKEIKRTSFQHSKVKEIDIPNSVNYCEEELFENTKIKHLTVNEKMLSSISGKIALYNNNSVITIKTNNDKENYILPKINLEQIVSCGYIDDAINMFVDSLNLSLKNVPRNDIQNIKNILKKKFLLLLKKQLFLKKLEDISINNLALSDRYIKKIINGAYGEVYLKAIPEQISCDGFIIKANNEKVKSLSLKELLKK